MNNIQDKIEEIMSRATWEEDGEIKDMHFILDEDLPRLLSLFTTELKAEREKAVREFVGFVHKNIHFPEEVYFARQVKSKVDDFLSTPEKEARE